MRCPPIPIMGRVLPLVSADVYVRSGTPTAESCQSLSGQASHAYAVTRLVLLLADGGRKRRRLWDTQSMIRRLKSGARGT